jgi:hypothetical protein
MTTHSCRFFLPPGLDKGICGSLSKTSHFGIIRLLVASCSLATRPIDYLKVD